VSLRSQQLNDHGAMSHAWSATIQSRLSATDIVIRLLAISLILNNNLAAGIDGANNEIFRGW